MLGELRAMEGVTCPTPQGAFYLFPNVSGLYGTSFNGKKIKSGDDVTQYLLEECNVVTVPGSGFGAKNNIRLSYACSMEELQKAADRMKKGFQQLK
ncbi:MAG: aminotransferase class I/II-fold pyridoxal phosphate-dependent enzyme, partial [Opitutaceae bacterium]